MTSPEFCHNCGNSMQLTWLACVSCGQPKLEIEPTKCPSCSLIINHESPNYCPFCLHPFIGKASAKMKIIKQKPDVKKGVDLVITEKNKVSYETFKQFLRFNSDASMELIQDRSYKYRAYQLMIISALFSSLVFIGINILFSTKADTPFRVILENYVMWANGFFMILFGFCIAYTFILSRIRNILGHDMVVRYTSGIAFSFILKDVFVLLLAVYVYLFEGSTGLGLAMVGFWVMSSIFLLYFILHAMVLTKQLYGTGVVLSFLIVSLVFGVVYVITFYSTMVLNQIILLLR